MILSRAKPAIAPMGADGGNAAAAGAAGASSSAAAKKQLPKLEDFLAARDYLGAMSLLDFNRNSGKGSPEGDMWLGYCAFHNGDYKRAMLEYDALTQSKQVRLRKRGRILDSLLNTACMIKAPNFNGTE